MVYCDAEVRHSWRVATMTFRSIPTAVIALAILALSGTIQCLCAPPAHDPVQHFRQTLQMIASDPPDTCSAYYTEGPKARVESTLFSLANDIVTAELNATPAGSKPPVERATVALKNLERMSAKINAAWPDEGRFHFQVLDISPVIAVGVSFRARARFFVLGIHDDPKWNPKRLWVNVGNDEESLDPTRIGSRFKIDLFPLHRGPSSNARFLSKFIYDPCAGLIQSVSYDAYEWDPKNSGNLEQIVKQQGDFGQEESAGYPPSPDDPFASIAQIRTEGPLISLRYCWRSPIDQGDNPDMCAVDTYDLSGDQIRFQSRAYNRPDLLPIAKAIEYAKNRDYQAILGYCSSEEIARRMVRDIPYFVFFGGELQVTPKGEGKEHVEIGFPHFYRFDIENRDGRWLITAFSE
ncbi:MAG: hypothetical protein WBQ94_19010 [Terracidiphilus sp.]